MKSESGFTLLEIILAILIIGIIAAFAGIGIVSGTKSYVSVRENAALAQKANLALMRITREISGLLDIVDASGTYIKFESITGDRTIGQHEGAVMIAEGETTPGNGDILVDRVAENGFTLTYKKGDKAVWDPETDVSALLSTVEIGLALVHSETVQGSIDFTTIVCPGNLRKK